MHVLFDFLYFSHASATLDKYTLLSKSYNKNNNKSNESFTNPYKTICMENMMDLRKYPMHANIWIYFIQKTREIWRAIERPPYNATHVSYYLKCDYRNEEL